MPARRRKPALALLGAASLACAAGFRFMEQAPTPAGCSAPAWCVSGTVLDERDEAPVPRAQVIVAGTSCGTVADSAGRFLLTCSDPPGTELVVVGLGYTRLRQRVSIQPGRHYVARVPLSPVPPSVLPATRSAAGD